MLATFNVRRGASGSVSTRLRMRLCRLSGSSIAASAPVSPRSISVAADVVEELLDVERVPLRARGDELYERGERLRRLVGCARQLRADELLGLRGAEWGERELGEVGEIGDPEATTWLAVGRGRYAMTTSTRSDAAARASTRRRSREAGRSSGSPRARARAAPRPPALAGSRRAAPRGTTCGPPRRASPSARCPGSSIPSSGSRSGARERARSQRPRARVRASRAAPLAAGPPRSGTGSARSRARRRRTRSCRSSRIRRRRRGRRALVHCGRTPR